jgi:hypothetical protein
MDAMTMLILAIAVLVTINVVASAPRTKRRSSN